MIIMLTSGIQGVVFGVCRNCILDEFLDVGFEVDVCVIASGFWVQVADLGLVHDLYVRQVLQGREGEGWWCSCRVAG